MKPVVIIGGGLSGLAAAKKFEQLEQPYLLLEASPQFGGAASTMVLSTDHGDFRFDQTGHFLHLRDSAAQDFLAEDIGDFSLVKKRAAVHFSFCDEPVQAPFQSNTATFPTSLKEEISSQLEFEPKDIADTDKLPDNYHDYINQRYGATLAALQLAYARKIYGLEVDDYSPAQMQRYEPKLSKKEIRQGLSAPPRVATYNDTYLYPTGDHGISVLSERMASGLSPEKKRLNAKVVAVNTDKGTVTLDSGDVIEYSQLISTIPLPQLMSITVSNDKRIKTAKKEAEKLQAQPVKWFALCIKAPATKAVLDGNHWLYVPEKQYPFYRIGCFSNVNPAMAPDGYAAVWVEVANNMIMSDTVLMEAIQNFLLEQQWIDASSDIVASKSQMIAPGYVLMDEHYQESTNIIHDALRRHLIHSIGRFGEWTYSSMGRDIQNALATATLIQFELAHYAPQELFYKHDTLRPDPMFQQHLEQRLGREFTHAAQQLHSHGLIRLEQLIDPSLVTQAERDVREWMSERTPDSAQHMAFDGANPVDGGYLSRSAALSQLLLNPAIMALVAHRWGCDPRVAFVRSYWVGPIEEYKDRAFEEHVDGHGPELKVMFLLTDLEKNGQCMRYWLGTHASDKGLKTSRQTRFQEEDVSAHFGKPVFCAGPAGTVYVFDTNAIHSGTRNLNGDRIVCVINITPNVRLYNLPRLHSSVEEGLHEYEAYAWRRTETMDEEIRNAYFSAYADVIQNSIRRAFIPWKREQTLATLPPSDMQPYQYKPIPIAVFDQKPVELYDYFLHRSIDLPLCVYSSDYDRRRDIFLGFIRDRWSNREKLEALLKMIREETPHKPIEAYAEEVITTLLPHCESAEEGNLLFNLVYFIQDMQKIINDPGHPAETCSALAYINLTLLYCLQDREEFKTIDDRLTRLIMKGLQYYQVAQESLRKHIRREIKSPCTTATLVDAIDGKSSQDLTATQHRRPKPPAILPSQTAKTAARRRHDLWKIRSTEELTSSTSATPARYDGATSPKETVTGTHATLFTTATSVEDQHPIDKQAVKHDKEKSRGPREMHTA